MQKKTFIAVGARQRTGKMVAFWHSPSFMSCVSPALSTLKIPKELSTTAGADKALSENKTGRHTDCIHAGTRTGLLSCIAPGANACKQDC